MILTPEEFMIWCTSTPNHKFLGY